ncbi:helix-turn-helix transcriptional regulator [Amycolatopsis sp. NPDC051371]|uniref:helix-turn-helix transcriptional regulator n=1 Tax=Amycolatopsis sp. NPDC051371 TaxID=3155800 RepID=UPI003422B49A
MLALHQIVGFGAAECMTARLHQLASKVDGELAPVFAAHAGAAAAGDGARLVAASEDLENLGFTLVASEAASQACHAYRSAGRGHQARAANARAWELAPRCQGARTPTLAAIAAPGLIAREREVAALAAEGRTSRQIAERLTMSVRTVDNHLRPVYAKLGISGRTALAACLALSPNDRDTAAVSPARS